MPMQAGNGEIPNFTTVNVEDSQNGLRVTILTRQRFLSAWIPEYVELENTGERATVK